MPPIKVSTICLCAALTAAAQQGDWVFDKLAKWDRPAEPVSIGMPFPKGMLGEPQMLALSDGQRALPVQATVTGRWPDGSIRWLFVRTLVDLPGNRDKRIRWSIGGAPPQRQSSLTVQKRPGGSIEVNTGPLAVRIPAAGWFPLADVRLNGRPAPPVRSAFAIRSGDETFSTADATVKLEVVESGPVAAVIRASGRHGGAKSPFDFSAVLTFWAGKPYVSVDYRVLAARGEKAIQVTSWDWTATLSGAKPRLRMSRGSRPQEGETPLNTYFSADNFRFDAIEHAFQSFWGDFWCDWTGESAGLSVTLRQAQQNFPKAMAVAPDRLAISLFPPGREPLEFPVGAAKTHQMLFHFHPVEQSAEELGFRSLQYQIPDIPRLESEWYARCDLWDEKVFEGPRSRRVEAIVYDVLDNRPVGMGIWNFGDEVDWGYTGQGRGRDDVVWLNNEYDFVHSLFVQYARAGERRFLDYAQAGALHWRDVDIDHVSSNERRRGGHIAHSARHVTGGVTPSHQWVEGLIDAWHFFGDHDAYQAALGIGDNILRAMALPQYSDPGNTSTRDMGWALRAMLALYRETGDQKYAAPCHKIVDFFRRWHAEYPGLLAPYTPHTMVRVNFMNSLTLVSLARYLRYFPDENLRQLVLEETQDMMRNGRNRNGLFYYKELPSLLHQGATVLPLQLLAHAFQLSGDREYLRAGLAELEYSLDNLNMRFDIHTGAAEKFAHSGGGYSRVLFYPPGGKFMGTDLMPILEFLHAARDTDLARQVDFKLRL